MDKAPESYLNHRRPSIQDAMTLEEGTFEEVTKSLIKKGYFTPRTRPWQLGVVDRGHGHYNFIILDRFGDQVAEMPDQVTAELIIEAVNELSMRRNMK